VCIVTHRKIIEFSCEFLYFSVGIFETGTLMTNFSVCTEKNAQKNSSPIGVFEFPVVIVDFHKYNSFHEYYEDISIMCNVYDEHNLLIDLFSCFL